MKTLLFALSLALVLGHSISAPAQGMGRGGMNREDMQTIHSLLDRHEAIRRTVKNLPNGVETLTESADPKVASLIKAHVAAMKTRLEEGRPIRMWDPLFVAVFRYAPKIRMQVTATPHGMKVTETSDDAYAVQLIQAHAKAVDGFVKRGYDAAHEAHAVPKAKSR